LNTLFEYCVLITRHLNVTRILQEDGPR